MGMDERNVMGGLVSVLLSEMIEFLSPLKWFALLGIVLVFVDLRFGVSAAKVRGEVIRFSRAGRRTMNKIIDYTCLIFLSAAVGKAILPLLDIPLLPFIMLIVVYGFEINSCYKNYFEAHGISARFDFFSLIRKKNVIEIKKIEENENITEGIEK